MADNLGSIISKEQVFHRIIFAPDLQSGQLHFYWRLKHFYSYLMKKKDIT